MKRLAAHQFTIRRHLIALIGICLCAYFSYHAIQGERSYIQLLSLNKTIEQQQNEYARLKSEREALEKRVVMLRPDTLDKDLLEERARAILGYKHLEEFIILTPDSAT